jgi:hypothetical protein
MPNRSSQSRSVQRELDLMRTRARPEAPLDVHFVHSLLPDEGRGRLRPRLGMASHSACSEERGSRSVGALWATIEPPFGGGRTGPLAVARSRSRRRCRAMSPAGEVAPDEPEATKTCCNGTVSERAGQFEESEEVDVISREFVRKTIKRKKARCACNCIIVTAPVPAKLLLAPDTRSRSAPTWSFRNTSTTSPSSGRSRP